MTVPAVLIADPDPGRVVFSNLSLLLPRTSGHDGRSSKVRVLHCSNRTQARFKSAGSFLKLNREGKEHMETRTTQGRSPAINLADIFVQGAMRIVDMQTSAVRVLLHTQGRSARMFGAPDWSYTLNGPSEQFSELVSTGAEQALALFRQTNETISELNQQFGQLVQRQTAQIAQEMRQGM